MMNDECTETIEGVKLAKITPFENGSCIVYIVLAIVVFIISIGITVYLVYYNWSLIKTNTHKKSKNLMSVITQNGDNKTNKY